MNWLRIWGKFLSSYFLIRGKVYPSFSQAGEDQVIKYLMNDCLKISQPSYLDVGTYHPIFGNNTYYFYSRGSKGVCVEPDPRYARLIKKYRRRDIFVQAGISIGDDNALDFFVFPEKYSGWNTFLKEEADKRKLDSGIDYNIVQQVPVVNINNVIKSYFSGWPNIISIDIEGLDLQVLKSLDFEQYKPEVICVESISFSVTNEQEKRNEILEFVVSKGYFIFADTYVNTIFCKKEAFKKFS